MHEKDTGQQVVRQPACDQGKTVMRHPQEELDLSVLLASGVHNLKNAIAAFVGVADTAAIRIDKENEAQQFSQALGYLKKSHGDLVLLLNLYKLGKALYPLEIAEYPVADVLREAQFYFQPVAANGLRLQVMCDPALEWYLDRELIAGAVANALENALRYAREEITLAAHCRDGWLEIEVRDDGPGFPAHILAQAPALSLRPQAASGRTGLGLLFATAIARVHRNDGREGQVALENVDAGGGRFLLRLP